MLCKIATPSIDGVMVEACIAQSICKISLHWARCAICAIIENPGEPATYTHRKKNHRIDLFLFGLYIGLAVGGAATLITCERVAADRVDCATQPAPLGIPLSVGVMHTLTDVQEVTTFDYEGLGRKFQLAFETSEGVVYLREEMTVNEQETAARINAFLQNPAADALRFNYVDWVSVAVGVLVVGGILGVYPGLYLLSPRGNLGRMVVGGRIAPDPRRPQRGCRSSSLRQRHAEKQPQCLLPQGEHGGWRRHRYRVLQPRCSQGGREMDQCSYRRT